VSKSKDIPKTFIPFDLIVKGAFSLNRDGDQVRLTAHLDIPSLPGDDKKPGITVACPVSFFTDADQIRQWAASTAQQFQISLGETFVSDARLHLRAIAGWYLNQLEVEEVTLKELLEAHARDSVESMRLRLALQSGKSPRGRVSPWTRATLAQAVNLAIGKLQGRELTQDAVALELQSSHPEIAPPTGDALGVLLKRHYLKWGEMKSKRGRFTNRQ
jgi:hypothetical protein